MSQAEAGKGSRSRPFSVSHEEWSNRWDAIFGRDLEKDFDKTQESESVEENSKLNYNNVNTQRKL